MGRQHRDQSDQSRIVKEFRDDRGAPNTFDASLGAEIEIAVKIVTKIVAIKQIGVPPKIAKTLLDEICNGRPAGTDEAGEPQDTRALVLDLGTERTVNIQVLPAHVHSMAARCLDDTGRNGAIVD